MIVAVLPAFNEAEALPRLIGRFRAVAAEIPEAIRILVVDDGSTDGTAEAAVEAGSALVPVDVVRHPGNRGLHGSIDTGLRSAVERCGPDDWVVTMDADDTHPPDLVPRMLERAREGHDLVIASRFERGAEWHGKTWDRILFSYAVSWMFRVCWPMGGVRDYTCGYRLYRADLLRRGYALWGDELVSEPSFACMPDLLWKLARLRPRIAEVPLALHYHRKPGPSKMQVARTIRRTIVLLFMRRVGL